jgi:hypothetical protein
MARVESLDSTGPLQHFKFIIPDGMPIASIAVYKISTEYILQQVISPINNRPPIFKNVYPLAIEWYSTWHYNLASLPSYRKNELGRPISD